MESLKKMTATSNLKTAIINTPLGLAEISGTSDGISSITINDKSHLKTTTTIPEVLKSCTGQLQEYFNGNRKTFQLKLNPEGTNFQKQVWNMLMTIPYGKTVSYLDLAKKIGNPKSIRAVANANGKNPLWIVVPCHRVIGSDGHLVGYAGGLHRKQWLLDHESPYQQQSLF